MNAPVFRYARWQLLDHLKGTGRVILLAAAIIGILLWRIRAGNPDVAGGAAAALTGFLDSIGWPLVVLTVAGMISTDRVDGYNRAIFSAPVSPILYYFQRWAIGGLVVATLPLALTLSLRAALGTWVDPWPYTLLLLLAYLLLGGLVFCWSTFGRRDWAIGASLYLGERAITAAVAAGMPVPETLVSLNRLLPPFHLVNFGSMQEVGVRFPAGMEWVHFLAYAVGLLAIGMAVLRYRPMGSGVRG